MLSVAEIVKRIEQGEDLESISRSLVSPAERALLKCCAIVRTFDESLVDNYFRRHIPDPETITFSQLIARAFVQRVPRSDGAYLLRPVVQKQYYDAWWESADGVLDLPRSEVPRALVELSASLIEYYAAQGEGAELDLLGQHVFVDKDEARRLFAELYKAADEAFDLARCRDIINVLTGRENVLGKDLSKSLNDTDRYLQSRTLWATEYYQTVSYYERKELKDEFEAFLAEATEAPRFNKWILHLHAPGGMGKTMFVRWLISRRCAPRPYTIPCGRVDFDFVDRITSSQHRWRLFLNIARALEVQIPGNIFHSLITRFTEYENILSHAETQTDSPTPAQLPPREQLEQQILYLIGTALENAKLDKPIILIFDTLEEVILYHPDDLLELVRQVDEIRKVAPQVLLILSGRYDLTEKDQGQATKLPQFAREFGKVTKTIRVKPFAKDEALGFLQEKKKLTKDRPLDVVVERSEGNPFKLALFADILLDDPEITAETIRDYPSADLLYLIERVLARIPDKTLHWLLRYGVVPRKLTRAFAEEVIKKHLLLRISGDSTQDDPRRYESLTDKIHATVKKKGVFDVPGTSDQNINMDELWTQLQNYASSYAWVTTEPSDPNTVVFHGDVVNPMRRWLEKEPVYKLLHQDAIDYYERQAETDPDNWVNWMRNAIYHKFQLEGLEAVDYWHRLLAAEINPRRRRDLAREIIGSEYVDENFKPRLLLKKKEIISVSTLVEAYYESALSAVEIARDENLSASNPLWSEADYDLQKSEELQRESVKEAASAGDIASLRAAILISQGRSEEATKIVEKALESRMSDHQRMRLKVELASAYAALGNKQEAERYWKESLMLAKRTKSSAGVSASIYRMLARLHRSHGDLVVSASEFESALRCVSSTDFGTSHDLFFELADVYFEMGAFDKGRKTIEEANILNTFQTVVNQFQYWNRHAKFWLLTGQPRIALEISETSLGTVGVGKPRPVGESQNIFDSLVIETQEQRGMAYRQLFEVEKAREALEQARGRWREIGNSNAAQRCMLKKAELWLSVVGDVKEAASTINEAARLTIQNDPERALEIGLLSLKQFQLDNDEDVLDGAIESLKTQALKENWNAKLQAKLILGIGAVCLSLHDSNSSNEFFADVAKHLKQVEPISLRMLLLEPLENYPTGQKLDWKVVEDLIRLVPLDDQDEDFKVHAPKVAELLRVLGRTDTALSLLDELLKRHRDYENMFAVRNVLMIRGRTSFAKDSAGDLNRFIEKFLLKFNNYPILCASTLVQLAELPYTTRSTSVRLKLLEQAEGLLPPERVDHWKARLLAVRGKLTIDRDPPAALAQLEKALSIYGYLGNGFAIGDLNDFIASHPPDVARNADALAQGIARDDLKVPSLTPKVITVHVEDNWTDVLRIRTTLAGHDPAARDVPIEPGTLLDQLLAFDTYENYSFSFLQSMDQNWIQTCMGMGPILIENKITQQLQASDGRPLCLMIDALQLSSPPWEMMVMPSNFDGPASLAPGVTYLYRALGPKFLRNISDIPWLQNTLSRLGKERIQADGVWGPKTLQALIKFQRDQNLPDHGIFDGQTRRKLKQFLRSEVSGPRPRVLLLRPSIDRQRATSRGSEFVGYSVEDTYKWQGFNDLRVVEDPDVEEVEQHVRGFEPDVIHICSTVEESTSIGIYLDFVTAGTGIYPAQSQRGFRAGAPDNTRSGSVDFLTVSSLAEMMRKHQTSARPRPQLILDVFEPPGRTELFTQLFLRNAFAAQAFQHGVFESIIAGGLGPPNLQPEISHELVQGLADFESVGETVNRMRRVADLGNYTRLPDVQGMLGPLRDSSDKDYLSTVVATAGIALFTQDPEM